ncbi:Inactive poly [ADP-ribose] polymerase SRO5 [Actinidia chinensis var. chinensis]|uniref:Inactive poly [ADP-ribose] polymerase SRO5 n=1 Tax=Actinidia chinensis var. chinensis TaxID=1590841 RepID=A0A2R6QGN1_ACTCC|nr:Inactive poly [ADP-ribose] polymerase SRO5 [Actinidia chinensis var. chinensis]
MHKLYNAMPCAMKGAKDSTSETYHDQDPSISDCKSVISGPNNEKSLFSVGGLIRLGEGDRLHEIITRRGHARLQSFHIFAKAMQKKCGGNANLRIGGQRVQASMRKPTSPWMPFSVLVSVLSKVIPPHADNLISKYYNDHREGKISWHEFIRRVRENCKR